MKKFHALLIAVLITATLSAFTTKQPGIVYFQDETGFHVKTPGGECEDSKVYACEYEWTGEGNPSDPGDPDNYQAVTGTDGLVYRP